MPKKPRIKIVGYYHIINKEVEQRDIFIKAEDISQPAISEIIKRNI